MINILGFVGCLGGGNYLGLNGSGSEFFFFFCEFCWYVRSMVSCLLVMEKDGERRRYKKEFSRPVPLSIRVCWR